MRSKSRWHVGVAIPARNEEKLLARCLRSVHQARAALGGMATVDIVVVADRSSDHTLDIAASTLGSNGKAVSINAGRVGVARATAVRLLLERSRRRLSRHWIANTDADCIVPHDWLLNQLALAEAGIEAVAGVVSVDSFEEHESHVPACFTSSYLIEPGGFHPHVHGANLGVRADLYVGAGGWLPLDTAEDHDLWHRLSSLGARRLSTASVPFRQAAEELAVHRMALPARLLLTMELRHDTRSTLAPAIQTRRTRYSRTRFRAKHPPDTGSWLAGLV